MINNASFDIGWFGVRYHSQTNASYVVATKNDDLVNHAGFSLYLDSDDKTGTFIVGGVNRAKYEGDLALYDTEFFIDGVSVTTMGGNQMPFTSAVGLDSGKSRLSLDHINDVATSKEVGTNNQELTHYDNVLSGNKSLAFTFGTATIDMPYSDLCYKQPGTTSYCYNRIKNTDIVSARHLVLPFIRKAYLTQNIDTKKLGVALVRDTDESSIVDFWF